MLRLTIAPQMNSRTGDLVERDFIDAPLWAVVGFQNSNGLVTACVVFDSRPKLLESAEELYISCDEHNTGDCEDIIFGNDWTKLRRLHIESQLPAFSDSRMPDRLGQVTELSIHINSLVRMFLGHPLTQLRSLWLCADWYDLFKGVILIDDVLASDLREMRRLERLRIGSADPSADHTYPDQLERIAYPDVDDTTDSHYITNFCDLSVHTLPTPSSPITITRCVNLTLFCTTVSQVFVCQRLEGVANRTNLQSLTLLNIYRLTNQTAASCAPDGPIGSSNYNLVRAITMSCPALRRLVLGHTAMDDALREAFEVKRSEGVSPAGILALLGTSHVTAIEFVSTNGLLSSVITPNRQ
ncbi:hypothetical protein V1508DRAFT_407283 [Lipomyces doorenjongii]|uniref:uncharacterized protein n=1 Tax=Lipomyces doorenjongii TaxID=383834 RepID=UPI0034CEDDBC